MKTKERDSIVYKINVDDIQQVANDILERNLTKKELSLVENDLGDYIDWFQAIENAIYQHEIHKKNRKRILKD